MRQIFALLLLSTTTAFAQPVPYVISSNRVIGIVTVGKELAIENTTHSTNLPVEISTSENSEFSGQLQNKSGIYIDRESIVRLVSIDTFADYKATKPVFFIFAELIRGNMAYCSIDKLDDVYKIELTIGKFGVIAGEGVTFSIVSNTLYVTRGNVKVGNVTINAGQSLELISPLKVKTAIENATALKIAIEACLARLPIPDGTANPQSMSDVQFFPPQPINPDTVSPSS